MKYIVGIDPGKTGAICIMYGDEILGLHPMPIIEMPAIKKGKKGTKRILDINQLREILMQVPPNQGRVYTELVHGGVFGATPKGAAICPTCKKPLKENKAGAVSSFNFGEDYGIIAGLCAGLFLSVQKVAPISWKSEILKGLPWKGNKNASILYVQSKYPKLSLLPTPRSRKPNDGLADAVCIAEYGKRNEEF